jgi:hypothetical protein
MYTLKSNQSEGCVCLISKKYPHLQEPLNKALTELETEGYMEALKKKWGLYD